MTRDPQGGEGSPTTNLNREALIGSLCAIAAFGVWGILPAYFKATAIVQPWEIMSHRIVWSVVVVGGVIIALGRVKDIAVVLMNGQSMKWLLLSATLLYGNFILFIWAVANGHILQGSLGYYMNPIVNVVLGVVFLRERLSKGQWVAVALAVSGVTYMAVLGGNPPWIAVSLALLFGFYGYVRKTVPVGAAVGFFIESLLFAPLALGYLIFLNYQGVGIFGTTTLAFDLLIMASGVITAAPLIFFTMAAKRLRYATLGFFQYMAPTMQFILAVAVYDEVFTDAHKVTFTLIWCALAVYSFETLRMGRKRS
jgi:chloramphenicol-sensitive protein RarD